MTLDAEIAGWKVLIVDDDLDNLGIPEQYLAHFGAEVKTAMDGLQGLQALEAWKPTFILLDLSMPNMDGWEMLTHIRDNPSTRAIPVIALTAHAMRADVERAHEAGFDGYITKPFMLPTLVQDIKECLERASRNGHGPQHNNPNATGEL